MSTAAGSPQLYEEEKDIASLTVVGAPHRAGGAATPESLEPSGLKRKLTGRHISIIAIASSIGTGLFLGSGTALSNAGPLGLLLGYGAMGTLTAAIALMTGELAAFRPLAGGTVRHVSLYTDKALGIANGWNFAYSMAITAPAEIVAASSLVAFWRPDLNLAIFISVFMVVIVTANLFSVRVYGESEFFFGSLKILLILGLIFAGLIVDWGGGPSHEYIGGKNWHGEGNPLKEYLVKGSTGRFLAFWSTLTNAAYALGNIQIVATAASEVRNPRVTIPRAMKRVFFRIFFFYIASLFVVGLILNSNDPRIGTSSGTNGSPFTLAFETAGIKVLPSIINAIVITSAFSSGNGCVFLASRTLVGLAQEKIAPKVFLRTNRFGSPWIAVLVSSMFLPLAYLECSTSSTPAIVFGWFVNLIAVAALVSWFILSAAYLKFYYALKSLGVDRRTLPYASPLQPYLGYISLIFSFLVIFFSGFTTFFPGNWSASTFLSTYINVFVVMALYIILKLALESPGIGCADMGILEELELLHFEKESAVDTPKRGPFWRRTLDSLVG